MNARSEQYAVQLADILNAHRVLQDVIAPTPLQLNPALSAKFGCNVYLKREDQQVVRSFKIRGAYYLIASLSPEERSRGVVCASAGNHAQGVAYSCRRLDIPGMIFMPATTPRQKINQVKLFGGDKVDIRLIGDTFDDAYAEAVRVSEQEGLPFVHPFDDSRIIAGNATIGKEIIEGGAPSIDVLLVTIGGGGLAAGVSTYIKAISPATRIIGVEPEGAPSMRQAFEEQQVVTLTEIDKFVDGAAVKRVGELTYAVCRELLDDIAVVPEGRVCTTILELYNEHAIVAEPAGALTVAALSAMDPEALRGKNVVCVISGGNNDIDRMQEIKERSLIYEGLKHYFMINFPQRAGALREFLDDVLGPGDDIVQFEYTKKHNKENGPALVGIELKSPEDCDGLLERMRNKGFQFIELNKDPLLFNLLI
ncbi:threonine dehydratase [Cohnella sp. CIP 111063]|uniref:threonine ammonia-lyase IlvA n=1 Tax=unclassified Cohnella TaxID=2636738 RepID=UPI000B8BDDB7|nr:MULTISPECIES: threonine ammonia-lyase IlvA [unclassified Cohnella]OXS53534.1 threonine dehydratase [Cohnella sp. CIP 111063]PRX61556.1 L-threonine ammonia-lyase [Cohnella sp. SGD-V74]